MGANNRVRSAGRPVRRDRTSSSDVKVEKGRIRSRAIGRLYVMCTVCRQLRADYRHGISPQSRVPSRPARTPAPTLRWQGAPSVMFGSPDHASTGRASSGWHTRRPALRSDSFPLRPRDCRAMASLSTVVSSSPSVCHRNVTAHNANAPTRCGTISCCLCCATALPWPRVCPSVPPLHARVL